MSDVVNCPTISRRHALGHLAGLLAAGMWPGVRRAAAAPRSPVGAIRFVVLNDFHHAEDACDPWMRALLAQAGSTPEVGFYLGLGDLADKGRLASLRSMAGHFARLDQPVWVVPGNHDQDESPVSGYYSEVFPGQRNHLHRVSGWQILLLDTSEGRKFNDVRIGATTLDWLDGILPELDPLAPTLVGTHFPLAAEIPMCPVNAEDVLTRLVDFNLRGVFSGHYHAQTEVHHDGVPLVTNACVARVRGNHDGSTTKGYWVCDGHTDGTLHREFREWRGLPPPPDQPDQAGVESDS